MMYARILNLRIITERILDAECEMVDNNSVYPGRFVRACRAVGARRRKS